MSEDGKYLLLFNMAGYSHTIGCIRLLVFSLLLNVVFSGELARNRPYQIQNKDSSGRVPNEYLIRLDLKEQTKANLGNVGNRFDTDKMIAEEVRKIKSVSDDLEVLDEIVLGDLIILHVRCQSEVSIEHLFQLSSVYIIEANTVVRSEGNTNSDCEWQTLDDSEWHLGRISSRYQHFGNYYEYKPNDGKDTYAYVVDSGIHHAHDYFEGRSHHGYTVPTLEDADTSGHGTYCAGLIMSSKFGVAKQAHAISVKVTNSQFGEVSKIVQGLEWVYDNYTSMDENFKAVVSMSLTSESSPIMRDAVQKILDAGLPFITAAGRVNGDACQRSPGDMGGVITVAASDRDDKLDHISNWGSCVDIIAPGRNIKSTSSCRNNSSNTCTGILSGTSSSTPQVAGAILRYMSQVKRQVTPAEAKDWVINSASTNRIDLNHPLNSGDDTPNRLLFAPCNLTHIAPDNYSTSNGIYANVFLVLTTCFVIMKM